MSILQAIVLGLVQGVTEFAPISSSGHLILVPWLFGWGLVGDADFNKSFDVALHLGTLVGAVAYFRHEIVRYLIAWVATFNKRRVETDDERIAWAIVIGTLPAIAVGATLESLIQEVLGAPLLVATMLAIFGVVMYVVDRIMSQGRRFSSITISTGFWMGVAQALALQPGVSRSGVTMTAGRLLRLDREAAARFSFLLAMPVIFGAGVYKSLGLVQTGFQGYAAEFFWGVVASAISGFAVIWWLLRYLRSHNFAIFMWLRLGVAALVFGLVLSGAREPTI
jgi:undecaprenyl-diphosphatase